MTQEKKITVSLDNLAEEVQKILDTMQVEMLERARAHREAHTYTATDYEEFKSIVEEKPGFVKAMWCGCKECEDKIKDDVQATSRCMPFEQETLSDKCVVCGKPAKKWFIGGVHTNYENRSSKESTDNYQDFAGTWIRCLCGRRLCS